MQRENIANMLMRQGLTHTQATSRTAEVLVNMFMTDEQKAMTEAVEHQLEATRQTIVECQKYADVVTQLTDERTINAVALFNAIIAIAKAHGVAEDTAVREAGYITYAYMLPSKQAGELGEYGPPKTGGQWNV